MATLQVARVELVAVLQAGVEAGQAGEPVTVCPFSTTGTPGARVRAAAWVRGWQRGHRKARRARS